MLMEAMLIKGLFSKSPAAGILGHSKLFKINSRPTHSSSGFSHLDKGGDMDRRERN